MLNDTGWGAYGSVRLGSDGIPGHGIDPGVTRWANPARRAPQPPAPRRTIRFTFLSTVAIPATCLILLWALAAGAVLGSSLAGHGLWSPDHREVVELTILMGAGLLVGLVCVILMGRFSYKLSRDIAALASSAQRSADEQLPQLLERLRSGETPASARRRRSPGPGRGTRRSPGPSRPSAAWSRPPSGRRPARPGCVTASARSS